MTTYQPPTWREEAQQRRKRSVSASNKLYNNDVAGLEQALYLLKQALRSEASDMRLICEPGDGFPARLDAEADRVSKLIAEYNDTVKVAELALIERWAASDDETAKMVAAAALDEDWSILAV